MTVIFPDAINQLGNTSVKVVQTIADRTAPKLATELNAASSVDASCFLFGTVAGTATQSKGEAPPRLCTVSQFQTFGRTTYEVGDLSYVWSPQGASSADANKLKTAMTPGTVVFLVVRMGLSAINDAYAASQKVDVWRVRLGVQNRTTTGDGEFDQFSITQSVVVLDAPTYDATLAA